MYLGPFVFLNKDKVLGTGKENGRKKAHEKKEAGNKKKRQEKRGRRKREAKKEKALTSMGFIWGGRGVIKKGSSEGSPFSDKKV